MISFRECYLKNKKASDYLKKRVSDEVINTFQVGFCPEHNILENFLKKNNFFLRMITKNLTYL